MTAGSRIFLAHAREDKAQVRKLYDDLKARGFHPWLDEKDLRAGQLWKTEIPKAIRQARLFLACLSSRSVDKVGYVQSEFRQALSTFGERPPGSIYLIPVRLDECDVPDLQIPDRGLSLQDIQWVDLWQEGGFDQLVADLEYALGVANLPSQVVGEVPLTTIRSPEPVAPRSKVAPDRTPVLIAPGDTTGFLSQAVDKDTLADYTKWKYPKLPLDQKIHELLSKDLTHSRFVTLRDVNRVIDAATDAVERYRKENPGFFEAGTDFVTKSLGFVDKEFRARHPFSQRTREAFLKYEHLVRSDEAPEAALDQEVIGDPPEEAVRELAPGRKPRPWRASLRHPTIVAAIIGAIGAVAAALSPWLLEQISVGGKSGQEVQEQPPATRVDATSPNETAEPAPVGTTAAVPEIGEEFRDCRDCPLMVALPAGPFMMGSTEAERQWAVDQGASRKLVEPEKPQHRVRITEPFAVGRYDVTRGQFAAFVGATARDMSGGCWVYAGSQWETNSSASWRSPEFKQNDHHPVVCVSWEDAKSYVAWLSNETGQPYRLLSEAEWEYVARAGTKTRYSWGDDITPENANYGRNVGGTTEAGSYAPNPWGLYDMNGNWEWVEDCWNDSYDGAPDDGSAWTSGDCARRVLRGGSWYDRPEVLRSAFRVGGNPVSRYSDIGFRVARTLSRSESVTP